MESTNGAAAVDRSEKSTGKRMFWKLILTPSAFSSRPPVILSQDQAVSLVAGWAVECVVQHLASRVAVGLSSLSSARGYYGPAQASAAGPSGLFDASDFPEFLRSRREDLTPIRRHQHCILDPNPAPALDINAGFNRDRHAGFELRFILASDARRLMDFETQPVPGRMHELALQAVLLERVSRRAVD